MPRIRSIHPDACDSEKLASLSDSAERTLFRLLTHSDDEGRGEDRTKLLAAKLYPLHDGKDADTVDADLDELQQVGLLVRYTVSGKRYYTIPTFKDWQNPRHPTPSKLPGPDEADDTSTADDRNATAERGKAPAGVGGGVGGGEGVSDEPDDVSHSFETFWKAYPRGQAGKPGGDGVKSMAEKKWRKLKPEERDLCLRAVDHYCEFIERPGSPHAAHAVTWLNQGRWEVWQEPAKVGERDRKPKQDPVAAEMGEGWR